MPYYHRNDIRIAEDQWIRHVDISGRQARAVDIDPLVKPLQPFWDLLVVYCQFDCCGFDALCFFPEHLRVSSEELADPSLPEKIGKLHSFVLNSWSDVFVSETLDNFFDRDVLLKLLDHIVKHITVKAER